MPRRETEDFQEELEREFVRRIYWRGIEGANTKELRRQAWPYLLRLFAWDEEPEPKTSAFTAHYRCPLSPAVIMAISRENVEEWRVLEAQVRKQDEEAFIAARMRKLSPPPRDSSVVSDVFEPEEKVESRAGRVELVL